MSLDNPTFGERLVWRLETFGYDAISALLRLLPVDAASAFGGFITSTFGPLTPADKVIRRNLELAFPEKSLEERERIRKQAWEEFGRFAAEFTMLDRLTATSGRIEIVGGERLKAMHDAGQPALMISGHFSNFEMMAAAIVATGGPVQISYRPANNPYFDTRVVQGRARYGVQSLAPKGSGGAREIIRALAKGESVAMLIDQKFNSGVASPLFGHMAHTSPGPVRLGRRFGGKVIPMGIERQKGARFKVTFYEPIQLPQTDDIEADTDIGVRQLNAFLEERIRARPHEWFWAHRRWPKSMYA